MHGFNAGCRNLVLDTVDAYTTWNVVLCKRESEKNRICILNIRPYFSDGLIMDRTKLRLIRSRTPIAMDKRASDTHVLWDVWGSFRR